MSDVLTAADVAARYGISRSHVYDLAAEGRIPCLRLGGAIRFSLRALEGWEQAQESICRPTPPRMVQRTGRDEFAEVFGRKRRKAGLASRPGATQTKRGRRAG